MSSWVPSSLGLRQSSVISVQEISIGKENEKGWDQNHSDEDFEVEVEIGLNSELWGKSHDVLRIRL